MYEERVYTMAGDNVWGVNQNCELIKISLWKSKESFPSLPPPRPHLHFNFTSDFSNHPIFQTSFRFLYTSLEVQKIRTAMYRDLTLLSISQNWEMSTILYRESVRMHYSQRASSIDLAPLLIFFVEITVSWYEKAG